MATWFRPDALDTELNRTTTYHHLTWFDPSARPPGVAGLPIVTTRFPQVEEGALSELEVVDLGLLPQVESLPVRQVARALWATVTLWAATRLR